MFWLKGIKMVTTLDRPPTIEEKVDFEEMDLDIEAMLPEWALPLILEHYRNKVLYGGRGGAKSVSVARSLVILAASKPLRIACTREFQTSIRDSTKRVIEEAISDMGLNWFFKIERNNITGQNGSYFFFHGIEGSREAMRSWQSVDICWVEEAQRLTLNSYNVLRPTIRNPKSELWFTFNPRFRTDPVYASFVDREPPNSYILKVNYSDNPWFPDTLEEERLYSEQTDPNGYKHTWEGEPDDSTAVSKVITYNDLMKCMATFDEDYIYVQDPNDNRKMHMFKQNKRWKRHAGLDVSDSGSDSNALIIRKGPMIERVFTWRASTLGDTARKADEFCERYGVRRLYYDGTGIGAAIRSHLKDMRGRSYGAYPVNFGSAPAGGERMFGFRTKNKNFFYKRNSQMAWNLRLRIQQTGRLLDGEITSPDDCLFIAKDLRKLADIKKHFVQPEWKENGGGQIVIDKDPEDFESPDIFDGGGLSFADDSKNGLKLPKGTTRIRHVDLDDNSDNVMDLWI